MDWSLQQSLDRDDDPYHAWSFLQRNGRAPGASPLLCPVLLEAVPGKKDGGLKLKASFKHILSLVRDDENTERPFLISGWDRVALINRAEMQADSLLSEFHRRLVLVYVEEPTLFPRKDSVIPDIGEHFEVLYIGRAIGDSVTESVVRDGEAGRQDTEETPVLAIIDESFAFLNDAFVDIGYRNDVPVPVSRFNRLLFLDRERRIGNDIYAGGELAKADLDVLISEKAVKSEAEIYQMPIGNDRRIGKGEFFPLDLTSEAHQPLAFPISHGTHVADTALRAFSASEPTSDELTLYGVTVPTDVTQDTSGQSLGTYLLAAIHQAMIWTDNDVLNGRLVINFSFGFVCGPKDGTSKLNRLIARLLKSRNSANLPTALVVPMGNSAESQAVVREELPPGKSLEVDWVVQPDDRSSNFMEVFSRGASVRVELTAPSDDIAPTSMSLGEEQEYKSFWLLKPEQQMSPLAACGTWEPEKDSSWTGRGFVALGETRGADGSETIMPSGNWRLRITNIGKTEAHVEAMIQRDDAPGTYPANGRQSYFENYETDARCEPRADLGISPVNTGSVFSAIDSPYVYVVGAGTGTRGDKETTPVVASSYASHGPRSEKGPQFTALADRNEHFRGIFRAGTFSGTEFAMSGSSVSAPQLAGYLAAHPELIGEPVENWPTVETEQTKNASFGTPMVVD